MIMAMMAMLGGFICIAIEKYNNAILLFGFAFIYLVITAVYDYINRINKKKGGE